MRQILVTRPKADFSRTAKKLAQMGYKALHAPMMKYRPLDFKPPKTNAISALIFTSANGIRAVENHRDLRNLGCYVVGAQTKQMALACGFEVLAQGDGDVETLCQAIEADYKTRQLTKPLLHISGVHQAGNLSQKLADVGIVTERIQAYIMDEIEHLPADIIELIKSQKLDAMLFYSQRSAKIFLNNIGNLGLMSAIAEIPTFCLSKTIAQRVCTPYLKHIYSAAQANEDDLLALLQKKL
ncbi:MAG: uroporphyrinogen-III synthase [Rhizobiales bacterium]|nr:uroporphyrinogen-III synthase [Hyphomicrobiales bacterium]NRB15156.1 uroporphyrinogen-III synthase [Hyphomicrobiales bacterium]